MKITERDQSEIDAARGTAATTRRPTVAALEDILFTPMPVLDHGFVRVIDYMGDDSAIVQAARVSYGKGTRRVSEDRGLIRYLMRHWHTTPFEMASIKFHVKLPIFVARQWIRHRTASVNEYSARYSILDREFYVPAAEHLAAQSPSNRQGRGTLLSQDETAKVLEILRCDAERNYRDYEWMLNEDETQPEGRKDPSRLGVARELARMNLTLNTYTQWYWTCNLHNLFHFLQLRADPHAQYEIRAYAEVMLKIVALWVPLAYEAFDEYRLGAVHLSRTAAKLVARMLGGEKIGAEESGLSPREWRELMTALGQAAP